jgi:hypothetical protein
MKSQECGVDGAATARRNRRFTMMKRFKVGDHVTWNSEAGHVSGTVIKVHTKDVDYKGYTHHASENDPQYEIKSSKAEHIAMHKGQALTKSSA